MRNFQKIAEGVDTLPVLVALNARPDLWNAHPIRTEHDQSPHRAADDILLMFNARDADIVQDTQTHPYPGWGELPVKDLALNIMRRVGGTQLGRVVITRLAPGARIEPHEDHGTPATFFQRFQLALQSQPGCVFHCGGDAVQFNTGDVWWFDNQQTHSVVNNSASDRIVMIMDIRVC